MNKKILIISPPQTTEQSDWLFKYIGGREPIAFKRLGFYPYFWNVPITGEIDYRPGERNLSGALHIISKLRKARVKEAVSFEGPDDMRKRPILALTLMLAGVGIRNISSSGRPVSVGAGSLVNAAVIFLKKLIGDLDVLSRIWFCWKYLKTPTATSKGLIAAHENARKVLIITKSLGVGGIENIVLNHVKGLDKHKYKIHVVIMEPPGRTALELMALGVDVDVIESENKGFYFIRRLHDYIRRRRIDILHYHGNNLESIPVRLAAALAEVPVIVSHIHGTTDQSKGLWKNHSHFKFLGKRTACFIACSNAVKEFLVGTFGYPAERTTVVYNGTDMDVFKGTGRKHEIRKSLDLPDDSVVLCVSARLVGEKGHASLIKALEGLKDRYNFICLFCGDGPLEEELRTMAAVHGLGERIIFLGSRDDMARVLEASDVFVLPSSKWEGLPLAILEAMAMGLPIVTTAVGGNAEAIEEGENGFVVLPDDPPALACAIEKLLRDGLLRKRFSESSVRNAGKHSSNAMVKEFERLYESR